MHNIILRSNNYALRNGYPQWYDNFHNRGYEVVQETQDYGKIWIGTETRDTDNQRWGRKARNWMAMI